MTSLKVPSPLLEMRRYFLILGPPPADGDLVGSFFSDPVVSVLSLEVLRWVAIFGHTR
jgi:hypothetical protein